jgi:hypothetical protein
VKNAAGAVVSTVAVQTDGDGTAFNFGNNGTFEVKPVAAVAGALPSITFGGATINNADAATNNTAAAAPAAAAPVAGTVVANELPVLTVPTAAISSIINGAAAAVSGVSFTDTDDNLGFTATVKATGTSQVSFADVNGNDVSGGSAYLGVTKDAFGNALVDNQGSNSVTITGSEAEVNAVLSSLQYTTNAQVASAETVTVTVTDAKGGSTTNTVPVTVSQKLL